MGQCPTMTPFIQAVPNMTFPILGSCTGQFVLDPFWINGTPPYTYTTNFGNIAYDVPNPGWATVTGLCAGQQVWMTITDANGCTGTDGFLMVEPPPVNPVITVTPACGQQGTGSVSISNVPAWYFSRTVFISTSNSCSLLSDPCLGVVDMITMQAFDNAPYVVNNLPPGNYYFGISFEYTYPTTPYYGYVQFVSFTIPSGSYPGAVVTPAGSTSFCPGGSVLLTTTSNANFSYQWKKNGTTIPGATASSYIATTSGTYKVKVTNNTTGCFKTSSTGIAVTVYSNPPATITPQVPTTFCSGDSVQLKANYNPTFQYQWKKNNGSIGGAITHKYTAKTAGSYKVKVTNSHGCTTLSSPVAVSVPCREAATQDLQPAIFPNPFTESFNLTGVDLSGGICKIEIRDIVGRLVLSKQLVNDEKTIQCNTLQPGIYFVEVTVGGKRTVFKAEKL